MYVRAGRLVHKGQAGRQAGRRVSRCCIDARRSGLREMTQSPSHYIISSVLRCPLAPPPPPPVRLVLLRAAHSAAQLRSPLRASLPQAQVFRRASHPAPGAHKFNAKVKAATTRNRVGRKCARYSFVLEEERRRERLAHSLFRVRPVSLFPRTRFSTLPQRQRE